MEAKTKNKGPRCRYDDGSYGKECMYPWATRCDGNPHNYKKLMYQYLASLSEHDKEVFLKKLEHK